MPLEADIGFVFKSGNKGGIARDIAQQDIRQLFTRFAPGSEVNVFVSGGDMSKESLAYEQMLRDTLSEL